MALPTPLSFENTSPTRYGGKPTFSGHESFACRLFWLKKGYDFLRAEGNFADLGAVANLGVGRNMVTSIAYWVKAFC